MKVVWLSLQAELDKAGTLKSYIKGTHLSNIIRVCVTALSRQTHFYTKVSWQRLIQEVKIYFVLRKCHKNLPDKATGTETCRPLEEVVSSKKDQQKVVLSFSVTKFLKISAWICLERTRNIIAKISFCLFLLWVLRFFFLFILHGKPIVRQWTKKKKKNRSSHVNWVVAPGRTL